MLNEGRRRRERGADVVVGFVETHGRARTAEQIGDLEVVPRRDRRAPRQRRSTEMDVDAVLAPPAGARARRRARPHQRPRLAATRSAGRTSRSSSAAGIDVISTVNIQHLESLNDVVERITGIRQRETVPDQAVRAADQIELVDMAPEALRRRLAHGNVYAADKIDAALGNYFRAGNLSALRELALLWVADRVDDALHDYRERHGITRPWETRERVVVALAGAPGHRPPRAPGGAHRPAGQGRPDRRARRRRHRPDGRRRRADADGWRPSAGCSRSSAASTGGSTSNDVAAALVELARSENATQIVLGASGRSRWHELISGSVINRVVRLSGPIDVHVISRPGRRTDDAGERRLPPMRAGAHAAVAAPPAVGVGARRRRAAADHAGVRPHPRHVRADERAAAVPRAGDGRRPRRRGAAGRRRRRRRLPARQLVLHAAVLPAHIADGENLLALVVYVVAAGIVAVLVDRVGRSRLRAARSQAEAEALAALAGSLARPGSVGEMLGQLRATFGFRAAAAAPRRAAGLGRAGRLGRRRRRHAPEDADVEPRPRARRRAGARRRRARRARTSGCSTPSPPRSPRPPSASGCRSRPAGRRPGRGQHAAGRAAAGRVARPAHAAGVDQGVDLQPAPARHRVAARRASRSSRRRSRRRPTGSADLVANLLDMSRLQASALTVDAAPDRRRGGRARRPSPASAPRARRRGRRARDAARRARRRRAAGAGARQPRRQRRPLRAADAPGPGRAPARSSSTGAAASTSASSTAARASGRPTASSCSSRSSALVDHQADGGGVGLGLAIARGFVEAMGGELAIEDTPGGGDDDGRRPAGGRRRMRP